MRKGLGSGLGKGYRNIVPIDAHIHGLSAKGVSTVNLQKYQGKWYNQASLPTWFDKDCEGQRAEYKLRPDGKVDVLNTCLKKGKDRKIKGTARSVSKNNKKLKVSFFPLIEGDYNILYLEKGYKNVIVGSSDKKYLWILSRQKKISQKKYAELVELARKKGYDTKNLRVMTLQAKFTVGTQGLQRDYPLKTFDTYEQALDWGKKNYGTMAGLQIQEGYMLNARKTPFVELKMKVPTVEILSAKQFDTKFKDDYEEWEQGYATTKIAPDGTTKIFVRDDGNTDYGKEGKLLMHELKEIEIFNDLVNKKGIDPNVADEMAHNMNPVKVEGVSDTYPLNPMN